MYHSTRQSKNLVIKNIVFLLLLIVFLFVMHNFKGTKLLIGDEAWAAASANGSLLNSLIFILRWDVHPPLYYLMVHVWGYISLSDHWLLLNSYVLHSLTVLMVFSYLRKKTVRSAAILASALVLVSPLLFEYSNILRMYSWLGFLSISLLLITDNLIAAQLKDRKYIIWYFIIALILSYSHVLGIFFVFFHFLHVALTWIEQRKMRPLLNWCLLNSVIGAISSLAIINSLLRSVSHAQVPSFEETINSSFRVFFGDYISIFIGLPIIIGLIVIALANKKSRNFCISFILMPIIIFSMTSYFVKPIWLDRNFTFMVAIAIVTFVLGVSLSPVRIVRNFGVILLGFLMLTSGYNLYRVSEAQKSIEQASYQSMIMHVKKISRTDKLCLMTQGQMPMFWTSLRYIHAYDWGSPMSVQPESNSKWMKILSKVPQPIDDFLKLTGQPNYLEKNNLIISSRFSLRCFEEDVEHAYILASDNVFDSDIFEQASVSFLAGSLSLILVTKGEAEHFFSRDSSNSLNE